MMDHPHIVTLHNTFQDDQNIYLCLEECAGGVSPRCRDDNLNMPFDMI
jgi:serine/threonine protein kinase